VKSNVKINMSAVADTYRHSPDQKIIEFSAYRKDIDEDGSFNTLLGGLIKFRVIRKSETEPEDRLIISVERTDPNVEVRWCSHETQ